MSLLDSFNKLTSPSEASSKVDSGFGRKNYYAQSEDSEFGKGGFYSKPQSKRIRNTDGKPVNTGLIVIGLIALIAIGIFFYMSGFQGKTARSESSFELRVLAGSERVSNASVSVYDGEKLIATLNTDDKGVARFDDLPEKELSFSVSASGLGQTATTQNIEGKRSANVKFANVPISLKTAKVKIQDKTTKLPVNAAKVFYTVGNLREQKIATSDESGNAVIELNGESIAKYRVVADGYKMTAGSLLATKMVDAIELETQTKMVNESIFFEAKNDAQVNMYKLTVTVTGTSIPLDGLQAKLLIPITLEEIQAAQLEEGALQFTELPYGAYELQINAPGYYPYATTLTLTSDSNFAVDLQEVILTNKETTFNLTNTDTFNVYIYDAQTNELVTNTQLNNFGSINLSTQKTYKAAIITDNNLPLITDTFNAGDTIYADLTPVASDNSNTLRLTVLDDEQSSLGGAKVALTTKDGYAISLTKETEFNTPLEFALPKNEQVTITASIEGFTATKTIRVNEDADEEIQIKTHAAKLQLNLTDYATNQKPAAQVTLTAITREGQTYDTCAYPCELAIKEQQENTVKVNAPNYAALVFTIRAPNAKQTATQEAKLIPLALLTQTPQVDALVIKDSNGQTINGNVIRAGENYQLTFNTYAKDADSLTIFALIESNLASIQEPTISEGFQLQKSSTRNAPSPVCTDLEETTNTPPYKWIAITALNTTNAQFNIPIRAEKNGALEVKCNVYARKGDLILRNPKDDELKIFENTQTKAWCYAQTKTTTLQIITPTQENTTTKNNLEDVPQVSGQDAATYDAKFKNINTASNEYEMQVDSIFPADAFPLTLQNDAQCKILLAVENSTYSQCFTHDAQNNVLKFATREINPTCPIYLKADDFYAGENKITTANANLKLLATCADTTKTIPVKVKLITLNSNTITPETDKLGDGDTPKLLYVINNRQIKQKQYEIQTTNGTKTITVAPASATPVAWKNQGQLSITTDDVAIADYFIPTTKTSLKKGTGSIAYKQDTCTNENCCAQGWCLTKQVTTQLQLLETKTRELAAKTAFRRGNDKPWAYYSNEPFTIATVTQTSLGAQTALQQANTQIQLPQTCNPKNPAVFQLTAKLNTTKSQIQFNAKTLSVTQDSYIQPAANCDSTSKNAPKSLTAKDGSTQLCGFLQGQNNCIYTTNESTPLSLDQVDKLKFELINCIYPVLPAIPACPATATFAIPAINLGNLKTAAELTDKNAFAKVWQGVSGAEKYDFTLFSFENQLQCIVPPSFTQLALFAGSNLLDSVPDKAKQTADDKNTPVAPLAASTCQSDFYETYNTPISDNLLSLAGVCCANTIQATACTPRSGKMYLKVENNEVKIIANWGLTETCYPYFPLPLTPGALAQKGNLASVAVGMYEYYKSGGTNVEFTLSTEKPGFKNANDDVTKGPCTDNVCPDQKDTTAGICITYTNGKCQNGQCHYSTQKTKLQEGQTC